MMQQLLLSTDNILIRIIVEPRFRWLRHVLLCLLLLIISYENVIFTFAGDTKIIGKAVPLLILIQFALYLSFYLNIYFLVPRFFLKGRYVTYSILLWALLSLNFVGSYWLEYVVIEIYSIEPSSASYIHKSHWLILDYISMIAVTGMCCLGTTITILFRNWLTDVKRKQEMESEHRRKQILKFKDAVNPDFLSEILCTAARSTDCDASFSADILIRLSRFLRYRLYDANREVVFLNSEAAFLDNYLSLVSNIRQYFSYSVSSHVGIGRVVLPPSILTRITEAILDSSKEGLPLTLDLEFESGENKTITTSLIAQSPGIQTTGKMEEILRSILDAYYPSSGYDLSVRGGGGTLYIRIGLNTTYPI